MAKFLMPFEDMPQEELVAPTRAAPRMVVPFAEEVPTEVTPAMQTLAEESKLQRGLSGAGQTFRDIGLGAKQLAGLVGNKKWAEEVSQQLKSERDVREAIAKDPYATAGKMAANVGIGLATPSTRVPAMAATGAMFGALTPQEQPSFGETLTKAAEGAAFGGLGGAATSSLMTAAAKAKNMAKGRFADPEYARRYRIFSENAVPASLGDITQNPTIMSIENAAQYIPGTGRKPFLERQAQRLQDVVSEAPEKIAGRVPSAAKEDLGSTLVRSVQEKYAANKNAARTLYDQVSDRVQAVGNPPVPTNQLSSETNKLLSKYPTAFDKLTEDPTTVSTLKMIASGTSPKASTVLGPTGQPIMKAPQLTFDELRALDSDLGALIRQGRTLSNRGEYNNKTFNQLVEVQKALRKDIENWSTSVGDPGIAKGVREANKFYQENIVPFRKNQTTRKIVQGEDVNQDTLPGQMFRLDSPWLSEQSKSFLTPEGVQAGRYYLLKEAERKAMSDVVESGVKPGQFIKSSTLGETGPKLFSADELGQLEDLQELVRASRRAGSYAADPTTGNRLLQLTPFVDWKIPLAAKMFSMTSQAEKPVRYLLSDPRMYTGSGALGQVAESLARKSGAGVPEDLPELLNIINAQE